MSQVSKQKSAYQGLEQELVGIEQSPEILDNGVADVRNQIGDNLKEVYVEQEYGKETWRPVQNITDIYQNHRDAEMSRLMFRICEKIGLSAEQVRALSKEHRTILFELINIARINKEANNVDRIRYLIVNTYKLKIIRGKKKANDKIAKALEIPFEKPELLIIIEVGKQKRLIPYSAKADIPKKAKIKGLVCRDKGFGFDHNMLNLFGSSSKSESGHLSGGLGEGLDMVCLSASREGAKLKLVSTYEGKSWIVNLDNSSGASSNVEYKVTEFDTPSRGSGSMTIIEFPDRGSSFIKAMKAELDPRKTKERGDLLLDYSDAEYEGMKHCDISTEESQSGNLYVQGLWINKRSDLLFSYNFHDKFAFEGRDRRAIKEKRLSAAVNEYLHELKDPEIMKKIIRADDCYEKRMLLQIIGSIFLPKSLWLRCLIEENVPEAQLNKNIVCIDDSVEISQLAQSGITTNEYCMKLRGLNIALFNKLYTDKLPPSFPYKIQYLNEFIDENKYNEENLHEYEENEYSDAFQGFLDDVVRLLKQKRIPLGIKKELKTKLIKSTKDIGFRVKKVKNDSTGPKTNSILDKNVSKLNGGEIIVEVPIGTKPEDLRPYVIPEIIKVLYGKFAHDVETQHLIDYLGLYECLDEVEELAKPHLPVLRSIAKVPEDENTCREFLEIFENIEEVKDIVNEGMRAYAALRHGEEIGGWSFHAGVDSNMEVIANKIIERLKLKPGLKFNIVNLLESTSISTIIDEKIHYFRNDKMYSYGVADLNLTNNQGLKNVNFEGGLRLNVLDEDEDYYYEGQIVFDDGKSATLKIYCLNGAPVVEMNKQIFVINRTNIIKIDGNDYALELFYTLEGEFVLVDVYNAVEEFEIKKVAQTNQRYQFEPVEEAFELKTSIEANYAKQFHTPRLIIKDILQNHMDGCPEGVKPEMYAFVVDVKTWDVRKIDLSEESAEENEEIIGLDFQNDGDPYSPNYLQKLGAGSKNDLHKGRFGEGLKLIAAASQRLNLFLEFSSNGWRAKPFLKSETVYDPESQQDLEQQRVVFDVQPDQEITKSGTKLSLITDFNFKEGKLPEAQRNIVKQAKYRNFRRKDNSIGIWKEFVNLCKPFKVNGEQKPPYERFFCDTSLESETIQGVRVLNVNSDDKNEIYERGQLIDAEVKGVPPFYLLDFQFPIITNRERTEVAQDRINRALINMFTVIKDPILLEILFANQGRGDHKKVDMLELVALAKATPSLDAIAAIAKAFHSPFVFGSNQVLSAYPMINIEQKTEQRMSPDKRLMAAIFGEKQDNDSYDINNLSPAEYGYYKAKCQEAHFKGRTVALPPMLTKFLFNYVQTADKAINTNKNQIKLSEAQAASVDTIITDIKAAIVGVMKEQKKPKKTIFCMILEDPVKHERFRKLIYSLLKPFGPLFDENEDLKQRFDIFIRSVLTDSHFSNILNGLLEHEEAFEFILKVTSLNMEDLKEIFLSDEIANLKIDQIDKLKNRFERLKRITESNFPPFLISSELQMIYSNLLALCYYSFVNFETTIINRINQKYDESSDPQEAEMPAEVKEIDLMNLFREASLLEEVNDDFSPLPKRVKNRVIGKSWQVNGSFELDPNINIFNSDLNDYESDESDEEDDEDDEYYDEDHRSLGEVYNFNQSIFAKKGVAFIRTMVHEIAHSSTSEIMTMPLDYTDEFQVGRLKLWAYLKQGLQG